MVARLLTPSILLVAVAASTGLGTVTAKAALPTAGTCVVSGTVQFSGINIVPQTVNTVINVGGPCEGDPLGNTLQNLNISASPLASCEAGFGTTSDSAQFSDNPPGLGSGGGDLILTPASGVATVQAGIIVGVLTFAWTTPPTACANPSGVTSTPITGLFTYVSE